MVETADVVIIGGGVMGASIAFHLAKLGTGKIVVLEKSGLAAGATGHAAGLIRHHYSNRLLVELALYSRRKLESFEEEMGEPINFVQNGLLLLVGEEDRRAAEENAAMQRSVGVELDIIEPAELKEFLPVGLLDTNGVGIGIFDKKAGYADPYAVTVGYAKRAKDFGVRFCTGVLVEGIEIEKNRIAGVITDHGKIATRLVVNAAGPWGKRVNDLIHIQVPVKIMSLQHGLLLPDCFYHRMIPTVIDNSIKDNLFFIKPESGGTILLGMDKEDPAKEINPDNYSFNPDMDTLCALIEKVVQRLPFLSEARLQTVFGGSDGVTPDWNPAIGRPAGPEGYFCAIGFSGHGFKLAPAIGEIVAQLVRDEKPSFDISMLDINRFAEGKMFNSQHNVLA